MAGKRVFSITAFLPRPPFFPLDTRTPPAPPRAPAGNRPSIPPGIRHPAVAAPPGDQYFLQLVAHRSALISPHPHITVGNALQVSERLSLRHPLVPALHRRLCGHLGAPPHQVRLGVGLREDGGNRGVTPPPGFVNSPSGGILMDLQFRCVLFYLSLSDIFRRKGQPAWGWAVFLICWRAAAM